VIGGYFGPSGPHGVLTNPVRRGAGVGFGKEQDRMAYQGLSRARMGRTLAVAIYVGYNHRPGDAGTFSKEEYLISAPKNHRETGWVCSPFWSVGAIY